MMDTRETCCALVAAAICAATAPSPSFADGTTLTWNGERVSLDSSGYLRHRGGFMLIVR